MPLRIICEAADREDLYSIALLNKTWNCIATPVFYFNRDLQIFHGSYACIRTLACGLCQIVMQRDLASFVESLMLYDPNAHADRMAFKKHRRLFTMGRRLARAVPRMRRSRSFVCRMCIYLMPETFMTLASGTLPHIRDIRDIDINVSWPFAAGGNYGSLTVPSRMGKTMSPRKRVTL